MLNLPAVQAPLCHWIFRKGTTLSLSKRRKLTRSLHRKLGPIVGIQLFLWCIGGIYFSWVHLTDVRSENDIAENVQANLKFENFLAPLPPILRNSELDYIETITLTKVLNVPVYNLFQDDQHAEIYDAITGEKFPHIDKNMAIAIADADFSPEVPALGATLITTQGGEYKGPIPAYKVDFDNWKKSAIYVAAETGQVISRRSTIWRAFDFLWMFHIMDYNERDNFNNWLIRIVSIFGLLSVGSGYYLWLLTTPLLNNPKNNTGSKRRKKIGAKA